MTQSIEKPDRQQPPKVSRNKRHWPRLFGLFIALLIFLMSGNSSSCQAQSRFSTRSRTAAYHPTSTQLPTEVPKLTRNAITPSMLPDRLEQTSLSACSRGLMSVSDFLFYQSLARDARLCHQNCSRSDEQLVWRHYQSQIREIAAALNTASGLSGRSNFEQESCAVRFAIAESAVRLAQLTDDSARISAARQWEISEAEQLVSAVRRNMNFGLASPFELASAEARFAKSRQQPLDEQLKPWKRYLAWQAASPVADQSEPIDASSTARLSMDELVLENALESEDVADINRICTTACKVAEEQFSEVLNSGTQVRHTLPQLLRSLVLRDQLLRIQEQLPVDSTNCDRKSFDADWSTLNAIAGSTVDRRGRVEADYIAVELCNVSFSSPTQ
ncbi:hypothetical protein KOR42_34730 [Thalassoglobus neptunius]|uniref:Uncharacterized protein n=1 Tax=Thalassoglobus neptunius TaxID=1938619 RepID=A0A5C5WN30_9PLAN|nr:hypothetical protein [Thalassoglobus neptunius]TWT51585.1 hypothetical protein KOR42_34730 [Thalassoglobus neptunius]